MDLEEEILKLKEENLKLHKEIQTDRNSINHIYEVLNKILADARKENQAMWVFIQKIKKWLPF